MITYKIRKLSHPAHNIFPLHCTISPIPSFYAYDLDARWCRHRNFYDVPTTIRLFMIKYL